MFYDGYSSLYRADEIRCSRKCGFGGQEWSDPVIGTSIHKSRTAGEVLGTEAAQAIQNGASGQISASIGNEDYRMLYDTIPQTG
ncbi:hypothetical protein [Paenibacillus sp. NPDC055715]